MPKRVVVTATLPANLADLADQYAKWALLTQGFTADDSNNVENMLTFGKTYRVTIEEVGQPTLED